MNTCDRAEALRDYAFDELAGDELRSLEQHLATCAHCAADLDRLRLTTAALRVLPDREIPQRIAFVSDKVFRPSPVARFFGGFWNSAARLGFASALVLAVALIVSAYHRPAPVRLVALGGGVSSSDVSRDEVRQTVAEAVAQARAEDASFTKAAVAEAERRHEKENRMLMVAVQENLEVMQKRLGVYSELASNEIPRNGAGQ
ncbi:MAG: zf-HC2 domain-containing protein [Bryobacteraceae bacterium]|jgi:anti-sigma factor RsiW